MAKWTETAIPSQKGRVAVVTGTGGLGYENAVALAQAGAEVIVAGRNPLKGADAIAKIKATLPGAVVGFEPLDLASLQSIAAFAERLRGQRDRIDLLINNAGVMVPPARLETADGFELQLGTNYLGHFALTGHLLPLLRRGNDPRVVTVSSIAARGGAIDFDDLNVLGRYRPMAAYSQSKLACLLFAFELHRRSAEAGWGVASIAAHPGIARTDLLYNGPGRWSVERLARSALWFLFQPASQGVLPTLFAATSPQARPGGYYGPDGIGGTRGSPCDAKIPPQALDTTVAERLWAVSERLTGMEF